MDLPIAIYVNNKGEIKYLTSTKVTDIIIKAVSKVYQDIPHDEVTMNSLNSLYQSLGLCLF